MKRMIATIVIAWLAGLCITGATQAGTLEAYSSSGVKDADSITYLLGNSSSGDLIQLIWVGANGVADDADTLGGTTADDSLLGTTYVGYGFPFNPNEGKFAKTFTHDLLTAGTSVFIRAWNIPTVTGMEDAYGNSVVYELQNEMDSHDFGSWNVEQRYFVPVELTQFTVTTHRGFVTLSWTTQSETENLGFHIYRSETPTGERKQITEKIINGAINSEARHDYQWEDRTAQDRVTYYYWLADVATDGRVTFHGPKEVVTMARPTAYLMEQNYPNPFNPSTTIYYMLKEDGVVRLSIYNVRGQLIRDLVNARQPLGEHAIEWDGRDQNGTIVPSGAYLYSIEVNDFKSTRKMALTK